MFAAGLVGRNQGCKAGIYSWVSGLAEKRTMEEAEAIHVLGNKEQIAKMDLQ